MPNPLSWYFHWLPKPLHKVEVLGNHFGQLVVPFGLLFPQPVASIAAALMIIHQVWLILSGNFAWLNWLTVAVAVPAIDDEWFAPPVGFESPAGWFVWGVLGATLLLAALSYWPARNLLSRGQIMNFTYNPLHLVNSYGAFGSITRERNELVVEGSADGAVWREYEFKGKPGDPRRRPAQVAPYHLRLDWLMWFAAISPAYGEAWLLPLVSKLLCNDPGVVALLRENPFAEAAPRWVRVSLHRYRFTTPKERGESGDWWVRKRVGTYLRPTAGRSGPVPREG
jgi:hypothetical protein